MSERPRTTIEAMDELRAAFHKAFGFDRRDFIAASFWTALGYCLGGVVWLTIALSTSLPVRSAWAALPVVAGAVLGLRFWWWARNPRLDL